ncbi:MAG: crossover junction endodeoxyribonuclease RuvC [Deltaproteobacteria bacterium]|nr:MAG: crossover junction endodeoxyribonuclease RuvC [Deltaproteobacteria bacterium]
MRVLGVDPGSYRTGYGVVECQQDYYLYITSGIIQGKGAIEERLREIYEDLCAVIREYSPQALALESPFVARNVKSALRLGQVQGVVLLAASSSALPSFQYSPMEVKVALTGYGRAPKEQVREMVRRLLGLKDELFLDASDALAVALCHIQHCRLT